MSRKLKWYIIEFYCIILGTIDLWKIRIGKRIEIFLFSRYPCFTSSKVYNHYGSFVVSEMFTVNECSLPINFNKIANSGVKCVFRWTHHRHVDFVRVATCADMLDVNLLKSL